MVSSRSLAIDYYYYLLQSIEESCHKNLYFSRNNKYYFVEKQDIKLVTMLCVNKSSQFTQCKHTVMILLTLFIFFSN